MEMPSFTFVGLGALSFLFLFYCVLSLVVFYRVRKQENGSPIHDMPEDQRVLRLGKSCEWDVTMSFCPFWNLNPFGPPTKFNHFIFCVMMAVFLPFCTFSSNSSFKWYIPIGLFCLIKNFMSQYMD